MSESDDGASVESQSSMLTLSPDGGSASSSNLEELSLDFSPKESERCWRKLQSCEEFVGTRRSKHTMVAWDDRIYVFGGDNGRKMLNDFLVSYVPDSSWARVVFTGSTPAPRYHHSAVVFRNSMFIFGGYTGDINSNSNLRNENDLYEYRFTSSQWVDWRERITGPLPPARSAHGAAIYGNSLWIFAGYDGNARLNDMWAIDLLSSAPQWEQIDQSGDSPPTCCNFPVAVVDDSMYVFSGQSGAKITNNLYQFKFHDRCWVRISTEHLLRSDASPPQRRYGHSMVAYRRCLYVFGGAADGILDNEVHCFDVDSREWAIIHPSPGSQVPSGRVFHTAAVCSDAMYVFGGTIDSLASRSGDLYRFRFSSYPKCTLASDLSKVLNSMQLSNVHFVVGKERKCVRAHAAIVAARSPFLRQQILEVYWASQQGKGAGDGQRLFLSPHPLCVTLEGVSQETFCHALFFMYTDRIHPDLEKHPLATPPGQVLLMMELYKFSLLLEMRRLELLCMQHLEASVSEDNVLLVLENASELNLASLKDYCMKFIVRENNYRGVIMSKAFESLDRVLMVQIVRRQQFRSRPTSPEPLPNGLVAPSSLQNDLQEFLCSESGRPFADVILCVGEEKVFAHKPILSARCAYFEALFRSFMPLDHCVEITFGKAVPTRQSFDSLLRYIYYGQVDMPTEDALYIFSAPNFFGFANNRLQSCCKANLEQSVSLSNVVRLLEVSDAIVLQVMKQHCLSLIADHFPSLVYQQDFRGLKKDLLLELLEVLARKGRGSIS